MYKNLHGISNGASLSGKTNHNVKPIGKTNINYSFGKKKKTPYDIAERLYQVRRKRDAMFKSGLFSEPVWDILLDLYIAEGEQKQISITSACLAANVPTSTGLRWITILIQNGYIERQEDRKDARRSFLCLTPAARQALESLFEQFDSDWD